MTIGLLPFQNSVRLYTPAWYVVSRGAGETQIHARPAAKTYASDCRIGKLCGYHKKPGILSLFWPTVDRGELSFYVPVSTVLKACLSVCGITAQTGRVGQ